VHVKKNAESVFISSCHLHVLQSTWCAGQCVACILARGGYGGWGVGALVLTKKSPADIHVAYDCQGVSGPTSTRALAAAKIIVAYRLA